MEKKNQSAKDSKSRPDDNEGPSGLNSYLKYAGMGFQMLAIIGIFTWAGVKLDERSEQDGQLYTAILSLLGVIIGIYTVLKDFIHKKDDQ